MFSRKKDDGMAAFVNKFGLEEYLEATDREVGGTNLSLCKKVSALGVRVRNLRVDKGAAEF